MILGASTGCSSVRWNDDIAEEDLPLEEKQEPVKVHFFAEPPSIPDLMSGEEKPPTTEEAQEQVSEAGSRWAYGHGFGRTVSNIGAIVVFPPYALYLVGNAGAQLAGKEPIYVTDYFPKPARSGWFTVYDGITSLPGRLTALVAGREFVQDGFGDE